jgi:hypothetical protein
LLKVIKIMSELLIKKWNGIKWISNIKLLYETKYLDVNVQLRKEGDEECFRRFKFLFLRNWFVW